MWICVPAVGEPTYWDSYSAASSMAEYVNGWVTYMEMGE